MNRPHWFALSFLTLGLLFAARSAVAEDPRPQPRQEESRLEKRVAELERRLDEVLQEIRELRRELKPDLEELKSRVALAESQVEMWKERVSWTARMVSKGYIARNQVLAEQTALKQAEAVLDLAKKDLQRHQTGPKSGK